MFGALDAVTLAAPLLVGLYRATKMGCPINIRSWREADVGSQMPSRMNKRGLKNIVDPVAEIICGSGRT